MPGTTSQMAVENGVVEFGYNLIKFQGDMNKYFQLCNEIHSLQGLPPLPLNQHLELILENVKAEEYKNQVELIECDLKGGKNMTMEDVYANLLQVETCKKAEEEADDEEAVHGTRDIRCVEQISSPGFANIQKGG
jgi:hypothetical protein